MAYGQKTANIMDIPLSVSSVVAPYLGDNGYKWEGLQTIRVLSVANGSLSNYDETSATSPFGAASLIVPDEQVLTLAYNKSMLLRIQDTQIQDVPVSQFSKQVALQQADEVFVPAHDAYSIGKILAARPVGNKVIFNPAATAIAAPTMGSTATATTGGTLAAATYFYVVTAINAAGETLKSTEVSQVTTGATSTVTINWTAVTGATGYKIYRATATGAEVYLTTAAGQSTATYTDTGSNTPTTAVPPTINTTGATDLKLQFARMIRRTLTGGGSINSVVAWVAYDIAAQINALINFTGSDTGYSDGKKGYLGQLAGAKCIETPDAYLGSGVYALAVEKRAVVNVTPKMDPKAGGMKVITQVPGFGGIEIQLRDRSDTFVLNKKARTVSSLEAV